MRLIFLGTGTSQGVPIIGCNCQVCKSTDPKDKRLRSSVLICSDETKILVDAGPDFRCQMLRTETSKLDAILITHEHYDHVGGMDDIRGINYAMRRSVNVYTEKHVIEAIKTNLSYAFGATPYPGTPKLELVDHEMKQFHVNGTLIEPIRVMHGKLPISGYVIENEIVYITDASFIPTETIKRICGCKILVINALRRTEHMSHFSLNQALEIISEVAPEKAYLTHFCHEIGLHDDVQKELPENVFLSYDGLSVTI